MTSINHDVFISYSTKDQEAKEFIRQIFDNQGISYFLDENDLELGEDIEFSLKANLKNTHFTVLLVSRNSLFSTWVCLESIHRLQEESFTQKTTFLPVLVDLSVMSLDFPLEMARHFKTKLTELEEKRVEAKNLGISTKLYNDEIERIEKVLPQISDIIQKIKNGLSANFADNNRKPKDLEKLIQTIKKREQEETNITDKVTPQVNKILQEIRFFTVKTPETEKTKLYAQATNNPKFTPILIDFEEKEIAYQFADYAYPEINLETSFQLLGIDSQSEKYIGFDLTYQENTSLFLYVWPPNYFQIGYSVGKNNEVFNRDDDGGCEESSLFALAGNSLVRLRIQIIAEDAKPLAVSKLATLKYYVNEQLIFVRKPEQVVFLPNEVYLYKKPIGNAEIVGFKAFLS